MNDAMIPGEVKRPGDVQVPEDVERLVHHWQTRVRNARDVTWRAAFQRMRNAMQWATWGCDREWLARKKYRANLLGRHVNVKVAALYAKQPTVRVRPRERLDSAAWDGSAAQYADLQARFQAAAMAGMPPSPEDMALAAEIEAVMAERKLRARMAKTLELLIQHAWDDDFKRGMKQAVRRALVCGVAYVRYDIVRGDDRLIDRAHLEQITDLRRQIAMIEAQMASLEADAEELHALHVRRLELERAVAALKPTWQVDERVVWSFPPSTAIIPDPCCTSLIGFQGADWVAEEIFLDREQVIAVYGVDVGHNARLYRHEHQGYETTKDEGDRRSDGFVCVWHIWDKRNQLELAVADGYKGFLLEPRTPLVYRERFFPWEPLIFNECELPPGEIFPPSEIDHLIEIQDDINQANQGLREHRRARRPLWAVETGVLSEEEINDLVARPPFSVVQLRVLNTKKLADVLQPLPQQEIDPAVYDTSPQRRDMQLVAGTQDADIGPPSGATATEVAVAQGARTRELSEDVDALDDLLTRIAQRLSETLLMEFSHETVKRIVGPGAAWPTLDPRRAMSELQVSIRAGSSGKPNREMEVAAIERVMPLLVQIPGIRPTWLAEEVLRRLDDNVDLSEALDSTLPSIVALNAMSRVPQAPNNLPSEQGPEGQKNDKMEEVERIPPTGPRPAMGDSGALGPLGLGPLT